MIVVIKVVAKFMVIDLLFFHFHSLSFLCTTMHLSFPHNEQCVRIVWLIIKLHNLNGLTF